MIMVALCVWLRSVPIARKREAFKQSSRQVV
jgi:hypothetical protein